MPVDITALPDDDTGLYYKDETYTTKRFKRSRKVYWHDRCHGRWQIEECFRIMKTDFSARPVYLQDENRIKAHFLICFPALLSYRVLENFACIQEQGFVQLCKRLKITDNLHEACGFRTDYQFITKSQMKAIQKKSKGKE